jgi:exodeoxyribonuclease V gamma subunit
MQIPHVSLQELGTFLTSPPAAFIRTRLGLSLWTEEEPASERIPISVDHLQQWKIGNRALRLLIRGEPVTAVATAERARGDLPPGALGAGTLRQVGEAASKLTERFMDAKSGDPRQVPVSIESPDGLRVFGTVADVFHEGIVRATFSKAKPKDEVRVWPQLLALAVARPDRRWAATLISKDTGVRLTAPPAAEAWEILTGLAELYVCGMQSPLPLPIAAACSYSKRRREGKTVQQAIAAVRFGVWRRDHSEREQPEFEMLWGVNADFDVILAEPPGPDENWLDEDSRFGMLARRVWDPVLHAREPL